MRDLGGLPRIEPADCGTTAFVGPMPNGPINAPTAINDLHGLAATFGPFRADCPTLESARLFFRSGGRRALMVRTPSSTSAEERLDSILGSEYRWTGMWSLLDRDFSMLSVPLTRGMDLPSADSVFATALELCDQASALFLLDPPAELGDDPAELDDWLPVDQHAAAYLPYLKRRDEKSGKTWQLPLSGPVAGVIARAEQSAGVWKSPAGNDARLNADRWQLSADYDTATRLAMRKVGVNICRHPGNGVVWGSRTLMARGAIRPDEKYVSVFRTAVMLRRSIQDAIDWSLAEPNDERLWSALSAQVEEFLSRLWRQGAFAGAGPESSYFVQVDESTMRVPVGVTPKFLIGFAPVEAGQFVPVEVELPRQRWLRHPHWL